MAYRYSTQLTNQFFDTLLNSLIKGGAPKLVITNTQNIDLVVLQFTTPLVATRTDSLITLKPPPTEMVVADGEASTAKLYNGAGELLVQFDVGSQATNPNATLIITSTSLFAGGMITLNSVELAL